MKVTIRRDNDPFKKYWWVLLVVFGIAGAWICMPALQSKGIAGGASLATDASGGALMAEQGLDAVHNPDGARGGVVDLSMDGSGGRRKADGSTMTSSLYQSPEGSEAEAAPVDQVAAAASAEPNYADALKDVSKKKADPSGWGGVKAQKGFTAPKGNFSSLSGLQGGSSGGSAATSGGAFGSASAKTGFASTRGLGADAPVGDGKAAMGMLKEARKLSALAASAKSLDAGSAMASRSFDGRAGSGSGIGGGGAPTGGTYGALDAAPANLKANDPSLDHFEVTPPPAAVQGDMENSEEWKKQLLMMGLSLVVGGMFGPMAGMMMTMVSMAANQRNQEGKSGSNVGGQMNRQAFNAPLPRRDYGFAIS